MTVVLEARVGAGGAELGGRLSATAILAGDPEASRRTGGQSVSPARETQERGGSRIRAVGAGTG